MRPSELLASVALPLLWACHAAATSPAADVRQPHFLLLTEARYCCYDGILGSGGSGEELDKLSPVV